jgi:hypothetical protein
MKSKSIISIFIFIYASCNNPCNEYDYLDGLASYLENELGKDIRQIESEIFYFVNMRGCETCIELNLEMLSELPKLSDVTLVLVGMSEKYGNRIDQLGDNVNILFDEHNNIRKYETGLAKPLLLHITKGKCAKYLYVTDFEIENAKEYMIDNSF